MMVINKDKGAQTLARWQDEGPEAFGKRIFVIAALLWVWATFAVFFCLHWWGLMGKEVALVLAMPVSIVGMFIIRKVVTNLTAYKPKPISLTGKAALIIGFLAILVCLFLLWGVQPSDLGLTR